MLRAAREKAGLHVAALAVQLKVPVRKLEALETDQLSELHDAVFVRALTASVCRQLRIDASSILARLPAGSLGGNLHVPVNASLAGASKGFYVSGRDEGWLSQIPRKAILAAMALLLAALVILFLPQLQKAMSAATAATAAAVASPAATDQRSEGATPAGDAGVPLGGIALMTSTFVSQPQIDASAAAGAPMSAAAVPAASTAPAAPAPLPTSSAALPTPQNAASAALAVSASDWIVFEAAEEGWVEAVSKTGVVLIKRNLKAGEQAGIGGTAPVSVVLGRAQNVKVKVRGEPFDTKPHMRDTTVARFEVK